MANHPHEPQECSDSERKRHSSVWMSDGTIIVAAKSAIDPGTTVLFKIHEFVLLRSTVLGTLWIQDRLDRARAVDQPAGEKYMGMPLFRLSTGSAEEIQLFFEVFYKPRQISFRAERSDPDSLFVKFLVLSTKYELDDIRLQLVQQIKAEWPETLKEWDRVDICRDALMADEKRVAEWPRELMPEAATSIHLGERFDVPSILPAAYYDLSRSATTSRWSDQVQYSSFDIKWKGARWEILSAHELLKLHRLRDLLASFDRGRELLHSENKSCADGASCHANFAKDVEKVLEGRDLIRSSRILYYQLTSWDDENNHDRRICHDCAQHYARLVSTSRYRLWEDIVAMYGHL